MGNRVSHVGETRTVTVGSVSPKDQKRNNRTITSKYSFFTFLPKNLSEQFRRIANIYFLIVSIIALVIDSPVSPVTSLLPLTFVITVTMAKQGYEDFLRHRMDHFVNNEPVSVLRGSTLQQIKCCEVQPGDVVRIGRDCDVPCDAVLLWSSDHRGKCFVTTANLDGETSLKTLFVPSTLAGTTVEENLHTKITLECLEPEANIGSFYGRLQSGDNKPLPLGKENLLLRGSRVKNTEWAIGCAVYTGDETKMALNSRFTSNKVTSSERVINRYLICFILLMIVEIGISFFLKRYLEKIHTGHEIYLGPTTSDYSFVSITQDIFSFLLLYYYCIPISLYVTIEMHKFIGSLYIGWDKELMCQDTNQPAIANNSDLNEELGQVQVLFSDKTGTLTKNDMYFQMCSVNGEMFIERDSKLYEMTDDWKRGDTVEAVSILKPDLEFFFTILAVCHTVQVENSVIKEANQSIFLKDGSVNNSFNAKELQYQATSSDEIAFVKAAANRGIIFYEDDANKMFIKRKDGSFEIFEKLHTLDFTSIRRRMSIIVKDNKEQIWLFCKGAESAVFPLCLDSPVIGSTDNHVQYFARQGLRTLAFAYKALTNDEYNIMREELLDINLDIHRRASKVIDPWRSIESNLTLIGATAIEDRLQDNVVETLKALREAGLKIWVLTGDKVETAINVAKSCGHIPSRTSKLFLVEVKTHESLKQQLIVCQGAVQACPCRPFALIVDGQSLALLLNTPEEKGFVDLALQCEAVICCRLSPLQKAQIIVLIKNSPGKPITAAIGDGANDISMIQEAHVGFGIFGREGRQAARSADFSFTKFMMLEKILLVHGHWYYQRLATLVQYFFYKNIFLVNIMLFFQIHCDFSTQSIFDSVFLTGYNLFFTSVPILILSLTEQIHTPTYLMRHPSMYKRLSRNKLLSCKNFFVWNLMGTYHSIVVYAFLYAIWYINPVLLSDARTVGMWCFGAALFHCLLIIVNMKIWLQSRRQNYFFIIFVILSVLLGMAVSALYSSFYIDYDGDVLGTYTRLLASLEFWLNTILIIITSLLPDFVYRVHNAMLNYYRLQSRNQYEEFIEVTRL